MKGRTFAGRTAELALVGALVVGGCDYLQTTSMTTEVTLSTPAGDRIIECRSDPSISADGCLRWGAVIVTGLPLEAGGAARLVLTDAAGVGRCSADFQDDAGVVYASAAVVCP